MGNLGATIKSCGLTRTESRTVKKIKSYEDDEDDGPQSFGWYDAYRVPMKELRLLAFNQPSENPCTVQEMIERLKWEAVVGSLLRVIDHVGVDMHCRKCNDNVFQCEIMGGDIDPTKDGLCLTECGHFFHTRCLGNDTRCRDCTNKMPCPECAKRDRVCNVACFK